MRLSTGTSRDLVDGERRARIRIILRGAIRSFVGMRIIWKRKCFEMELKVYLNAQLGREWR